VSFMAPVSPVTCLLWLRYLLSFMAPVSGVVPPVAPVSPVVLGSSISCRSWLQYLLSFVAPVSVACGSIQYCLLVALVSVVRGSSLLWLSFMAPVSVVRGTTSIICRLILWLLWLQQWLKYYLLSLPVAPSFCSSLLWLPWSSSILCL